jgi:hypothetical protein
MLNDDVMEMLTSLKACECCFVGADLPAIGSAPRGFNAEGVDGSRIPLVKSASETDRNESCGMHRRHTMAAVALWTVSEPKVRHVVALALSEKHYNM